MIHTTVNYGPALNSWPRLMKGTNTGSIYLVNQRGEAVCIHACGRATLGDVTVYSEKAQMYEPWSGTVTLEG